MKQIGFSGSFSDIERLCQAKAELQPGETIEILLPARLPRQTFPDGEENAFQSFLFAVQLLRKEAESSRSFSVVIKNV